MKLASHTRVVRLAPRQYISGTVSRGDICPSPPLSSSCERTLALQASGTIAVNDGMEGGSQKEPASRVAVVVSVHANSLSHHLLLPSPLSTDSKEPMATELTPRESTPTDPLPSAKEPAPVLTLTELKVKESTSPESSTVSMSHPPMSNKEESKMSPDTNNAPLDAAFLAFHLSTANEKHKPSSKLVDSGEKKLMKAQSRRQREWKLAIAYATGTQPPAEPSTSACQDERQTWSKAKAQRERGKRLAIAHATGVAGSGSGSIQ
jgi:hypothetical protein